MKIRSINIIIIIYLFFFISDLSAIENKILAKVDNEIITTIDIYNEIKYLSLLNANLKKLKKKKPTKFLKILIREKIKEIEIKKILKA